MGFITDQAKRFMKAVFEDGGDITSCDPYAIAKQRELISTDPSEAGARMDWWEIFPERWHQVFPYQFIIMQNKKEDSSGIKAGSAQLAIYTLPIPPQALNMRMVSASNVTPTLGGVVEETSANVFWEISLNGTTGVAVGKAGNLAQQLAPDKKGIEASWSLDYAKSLLFGDAPKVASKFREVIKTTGELSGIFGALQGAAGKVLGGLDQLDKVTGSGATGGVGAANGMLQQALLPSPMFNASSVSRTKNGFGEIQQMQRFLLVYSRLKGAFPNEFFLKFVMHKTNQQWMCSIKDFQISQNAQNPMLYRYSIQLKCWQVGSAGKEEDTNKMAYDRFGVGGDLAPVNILSVKQASKGLKSIFRGK